MLAWCLEMSQWNFVKNAIKSSFCESYGQGDVMENACAKRDCITGRVSHIPASCKSAVIGADL